MKKYLLVDTANLFFRARHSAHRSTSAEEKAAFALHVTLMAANKMVRRFETDHVVFALEGRSWRKDFYKPYKANRAVTRAAMTVSESEEDRMFWETYDALTTYLSERTNCSVVRHATAEADDVIARWISLHPQDQHIIISSDTDFVQLLSENVQQYNGISDQLITVDGIFDAKGKRVKDKKTKEELEIPDPKWLLFQKCMRGDASDNVFSAYPGVRTKGSRNKVGLQEAFEDRHNQGFSWNNLMLQKWMDHHNIEHRVKDDYERNCVLVDLTAQPLDIKAAVDAAIYEMRSSKSIGQVGVHFLKFCGKYDLVKLSESADQFGRWMNETYQGVLNDRG